ncbi:MAG: phage major capsid protein [Gammaproteobacteria bacterium]|nr:phage major capsid protein [Gammaproteobacteria bacterium]
MDEKIRQILIRQSETREALNDCMAAAEPDEAKLTDLRTKAQGIERELREALAKPADGSDDDASDGGAPKPLDAEARELRELRSKVRVMDYVSACVAGNGISGAAAEFAEACNTPGEMPISLLFDDVREVREREVRAAATVAADAIAEIPDPTAPEVFVSPLAMRLGIRTPTVPAGHKSYPYVGTGVTPAAVAKGDAIGDSSPAIQALTASPKALSATFMYQREDAATLADLDSALSMNLRESMADEFDDQVVAGDNTGANLNGLLKQRAPTAPADNTLSTFANVVTATAAFVDGKFAEAYSQVQLVMAPQVAHYLKALFRGTATEDSAYEWLSRNFGGITISSRAPQISAVNHATSGDRRAGGGGVWGVRMRVPSLAYAPVWSGVQFVRDEITGAKKREVSVTAYMLAGGVAIVRPNAYTVATIKTVAGVAP